MRGSPSTTPSAKSRPLTRSRLRKLLWDLFWCRTLLGKICAPRKGGPWSNAARVSPGSRSAPSRRWSVRLRLQPRTTTPTAPPARTVLRPGASPTAGAIEFGGDRDVFRFDADAGEDYVIETSQLGTGSDTILDLFDPRGRHMLRDDDGGQGYASRIAFSATESATYWLMVTHYDRQNGTGSYAIELDRAGAPAPAPAPAPPVATTPRTTTGSGRDRDPDQRRVRSQADQRDLRGQHPRRRQRSLQRDGARLPRLEPRRDPGLGREPRARPHLRRRLGRHQQQRRPRRPRRLHRALRSRRRPQRGVPARRARRHSLPGLPRQRPRAPRLPPALAVREPLRGRRRR